MTRYTTRYAVHVNVHGQHKVIHRDTLEDAQRLEREMTRDPKCAHIATYPERVPVVHPVEPKGSPIVDNVLAIALVCIMLYGLGAL